MSGMVSPFGDPNVLLRTLSGQQTADVQAQQIANQYAPAKNQLLLEQGQQQVGQNEAEMMSRAAAGVLGLPAEQRPAAYSAAVGNLQRYGFAKNAPSIYPGDATLQSVANMGVPIADQYKLGIVTAPGLQQQIDRILGPGQTPAPSTGGGGGTSEFNFGNIRPQGGTGFNTYATPQEGIAAMASNLAAYKNEHGINTLNGLTARWAPKGDGANDPVAYAKRLGATLGIDPDAEINLADPLLQMRLIPAMAAVEKGRPLNQPADVLTAGIKAGLGGPGGPPAPSTQAARLGGVAAAGPAAGAPAGSTAPPVAAPAAGAADLNGPRPLPPVGPGSPTPPTPTQLANTPMPQAPVNGLTPPPAAVPAPAPAAAAPQAQPQGAPAQPPPSAAPAAAQPQLPPSGVNSQQYQQAMDLQRKALALDAIADPTGRTKLLAAGLRQQAQLLLQTDSVVQLPDGRQFHPLTGAVTSAGAPNPHYVWDEKQGSFIDTTGTHPPVTPPSPRLTNVEGVGVVQSKPGGGAEVVVPMNPAGMTTQKAAEAAGTQAGTAAGKLTTELAAQGQNATQAIGNIDYGIGQLRKAAAGGIPTGYFSNALAEAAAMAKSLGIDTSALGVNPEAVGNIQSAQKTLAVVAGAILQQAIGKGSQITDAKIEHFIHAQPDIQTDPHAVERVLNWARSQFVYEREMAAQGMKDASDTGVLPANWKPNYYDKHGFAPIYNPGTGEMQQPDGSAPGREPPAATPVTTAPVNPAARTVGTTYQTPKGPMTWDGKLWQTPSK
jgi:hypothetical protein